MTVYAGGSNWERTVRAYMESVGYQVIRSAGSKGAIDLICWNDESVHLIQCKKTSRKVNLKGAFKVDIEKLTKVSAPEMWGKQIWLKEKRNVHIYDLRSNSISSTTIGRLNDVVKNNK